MRILIVTQYFWPESFLVNDLAAALQRRGHELTVLTGQPNYPGGRMFDGYHAFSTGECLNGIRIVRVPLVPRGQSRRWRLLLNYGSFAASASCLGPLRLREQFDLIFVFEPSPVTVGLPAIVMKGWRGVPLFFWVQDAWPEVIESLGIRNPWLLKNVTRLVEWIYHRCDRVLVQSESFGRSVVARGVPQEHVVQFPNWAADCFQPMELEHDAVEHQELPRGFRLLFAGNIGKSQSFETLVAAAELTRHRPDLKWIVIGDGRERHWLEQELSKRDLTATFCLLPRRPMEQMPRYFAAADALLVSLKRDLVFEMTIPSKLQTYLACGRPVLASLDGEGAEVVKRASAGLVAAAEDPNELAARALEMADLDAAARAEMGRAGRRYYEMHFEREMLLDRLEAVAQEVVSNWRAPCAA